MKNIKARITDWYNGLSPRTSKVLIICSLGFFLWVNLALCILYIKTTIALWPYTTDGWTAFGLGVLAGGGVIKAISNAIGIITDMVKFAKLG